MGDFKIGCQTYTWEMLGKEWKGSVDDILDCIKKAGYEGVEITNNMIGTYYNNPDAFARALEKRGIKFAAFGFVPLFQFTDYTHFTDEIKNAEKGIEFLSNFPGTKLELAGGSARNRENLEDKFKTMCRIYNEIAERAMKKNVKVDVHPHSHAGSIIETPEEYEKLMGLTEPDLVGWCPDSGHIIRSGLDLIKTLTKYKKRIRNIHFKDVDKKGVWKPMGKGICDFKKILKLLENIGYKGWIIAEEESEEARNDQTALITANRIYLKSLGL